MMAPVSVSFMGIQFKWDPSLPYPRGPDTEGREGKGRGPLASTAPLEGAIKWDPSPPDPRGHKGKWPTCEYLYFMPRYRGP